MAFATKTVAEKEVYRRTYYTLGGSNPGFQMRFHY
jgi:hypothetical protein